VIDTVNRYFLLDEKQRGLDMYAAKDEIAMIDHLVRVLMLRDDSGEARQKVRDAVELALRHIDSYEPHEFLGEGDGTDCRLCHEGRQYYLHTDREVENG
jgi:ABC-type Mn2+/Zn2+ transport system ATPase subunit